MNLLWFECVPKSSYVGNLITGSRFSEPEVQPLALNEDVRVGHL